MAVVETLDVILAAKTAQFNQEMRKEAANVGQFKKQFESPGNALASMPALAGPAGMAVGAAFAGATAAIAGATSAVIALHSQMAKIDELADAATQLGINFKELQVIRISFGESAGLDASAVDSQVMKFQKSLSDAASGGGKELNMMFESVGLNASQLLRDGPVLALSQVSEAMQNMNTVDQMRLAFELWGKGGLEVVKAITEFGDKAKDVTTFMESRGLVLSESQIAAVGAANDAWDRFSLTVDSVASKVAAEFAPVFSMVLNTLNDSSVVLGGWIPMIEGGVTQLVYFSGVLYDVYEVVTLVNDNLRAMASLDFSKVAENTKNAFDFSTGQNLVDNLQVERDKAAQEALDKAKKLQEEKERKASFDALSESEAIRKKQDALLENFQVERSIQDQLAGLASEDAKRVEAELRQQLKLKKDIAAAGFVGEHADNLLLAGMQEFKDRQKAEKDRQEKDRLTKEGEQLAKRFNPMIEIQKQFDDIQKMLEGGMIDSAVAQKASMDAAGKAVPQFKGAVSAQEGSVEAYKLILERDNQRNQQEAIKQLAQRQLDALNKIANSSAVIKVAR